MRQSTLFICLCPRVFRLTLLMIGMASACFCSQGPQLNNFDNNCGTKDFAYTHNLGWYKKNLQVGGAHDLAKIAVFYKIAADAENAQAKVLLIASGKQHARMFYE